MQKNNILIPVDISNSVFNQSYNEALIHQVVTACQSNYRQGSHQQKTRAEVRGGGIKPWRQKGTGRARAGTIRSPIWRHGGVTFAARPGIYHQKINKKMYTGAIISLFSQLLRDNRLLVINQISIDAPKTRLLIKFLDQLDIKNVLIIVDKIEDNLALASRNIVGTCVINLNAVNPVILMAHEKILITKEAFEKLNEAFKHGE